ncbi:Mariner Mos1 transposase [Eumeta japonica]|uniref:Mariner Mos1 transposase n=1 Tax=Eumeta variegata TaxID=151549 RepID=A0A4C1VXA6_EUMVA|nr:Mariner Mos1 transposase [Eumeta japonica]
MTWCDECARICGLIVGYWESTRSDSGLGVLLFCHDDASTHSTLKTRVSEQHTGQTYKYRTSTNFTYGGRSTTATGAPNPLQFIDGASACIYELHTLHTWERGHALPTLSVRPFVRGSSATFSFWPQPNRFCPWVGVGVLRSSFYSIHDKIILLQDNAPPHVAVPVKNYMKTFDCVVLPHPQDTPNIAPSDYNLFRSMAHALLEQQFTSMKIQKIGLIRG